MTRPPDFYGQAAQDYFVKKVLKEKRNGTFLEIGSRHPIEINNSYILETQYDWRGIMVEYDRHWLASYKQHRPKSYYIMEDATRINYLQHFQDFDMPTNVDYMQIDLEVNNRSTLTTLENVNTQLMDNYKFAVVTFEHDIYTGNHFDTRAKSREIFDARGYFRVFQDVQNTHAGSKYYPFEDWYVHPDLVDMDYIRRITSDVSLEVNDIIKILRTTV